MAGFISIKPDDASPILAVLSRFASLNQTAMFEEIGAHQVNSTQQNFLNQSTPDGSPWKQSWRAKLQSGETLRDTGRLMNSITFNASANGVEVGSDLDYAHVMHFGAHILPKTAQYLTFQVAGQWRKVKEVNIPSREFLGINQDDENSILDIIERCIYG